MSFLRVWLTGYFNPVQLIERLKSKPAPQWGIFASLLRGILDSLLIYLPVSLMGRVPPTPSYLSFVPTERYYFALIWMAPFVLLAEMLMGSVVIHVLLRLMGRHGDIDQVININGMSALIVGAVLILWDWTWFALGMANQYFLGISHLVISLWAVAIMAIGLRRILSVPFWLSIALSIIIIPVGLPFAMMFMRSPF
ncbi:MAG: YIP1 family protein [Candidatus Hodarchaeota archaeon]